MNELIWFSIPGAIFLFAVGLVVPNILYYAKPESAAIIIVAIPIIGFIIHQFWRTIFERCSGFDSPKRTVISEIMKETGLNNKEAFLVWELTFYSDDFPDSFRKHDRGAWHFIMSFNSCALASILSIILLSIILVIKCPTQYNLWWMILFVCFFILFAAKAILTQKSLYRQEVGIFKIYKDYFFKNVNKINTNQEEQK